MRKGFACLFYGAPGTGKTETVLQIARQTGRDLMQIDIAGLRDKWVGESEKNIKEVFARYRDVCRRSEVMPILFFNEADAIINKRTENVAHSVDKMDNAMQNIILQELEDLEGILIATTNLTSNLDRAFERRFLFKVEFKKPTTDVKAQIWKAMLNDITPDDARQLASHFDFSGGQIENIARKRTIDYVLSGKFASFDEIEGYCHAELLSGKEHRCIGFK
jgi:SpoVK/Ycf46/Vps4 family AAA+-type ATPase